jgi:hypothetical protein
LVARVVSPLSSDRRCKAAKVKTPALGDHQTRKLLGAPEANTINSKRDCAILSTLFHAPRREELRKLKVNDAQHARKGVPYSRRAAKVARLGLRMCSYCWC